MQRQIELVHLVVCRRLQDACAIAESSFAEAVADPHIWDRHRLILSARVPFLFDCNCQRAEEILDFAQETVRAYPSTYVALRIRDVHASMCIDSMRLNEAADALESIDAVSKEYFHATFSSSLRETSLRLAIARGKDDALRMIAEELQQTVASDLRSRQRMFFMAGAIVGLVRARERSAVAELLPALRDAWAHSLGGCPLDYPCVALGIGLRATGAVVEAERLVADYFSCNRVASHPPNPFVQSLADEFAISLSA